MLEIKENKLAQLTQGYRLAAQIEGKSRHSIDIVANSINYLDSFLRSEGLPTEVNMVGTHEIRAFILHLQHKKRFSCHRFNKPQEKGISGITINCYLRSLRIFFSWLVSEGIIAANPFEKVKIPSPPKKVIPTFSDSQLEQLLKVIDKRRAEGYRDYSMILTLLDTGLRVSELCGLELKNVWLDEGMLKITGKGNKERLIPIGKQLQRILWRYIHGYRPEPACHQFDNLFLTREGQPLSKDRVDKIMSRYGTKAEIAGIRCSPHTLRHTAAVRFLRNGGDVFSLQRLLGHASLEMTRRYCELADIDVKHAHMIASPVDNLGIMITRPRKRIK